MITDFIAISNHMLQRVACVSGAAAANRGRHVDMGMHAVVEQALPSILDSVTRARKLKPLVREESMRRFLNDVVNEREGYRVATGNAVLNPPNALPLHQLLQQHLGDATTSAQTWKTFANSNKAVLGQVLEVVETHRQQVFDQQHLFGGAHLVANTSGGSSRGKQASLVVETGCREEELDEYDRAHRVMRDCVVRALGQTKSPPPSPKAKRVYMLTESERQVASVSRIQRRGGTCTLAQLFAETNVDDVLIPENYAPPFDRNDLFLTNVDAANELTVSAARTSEQIVAQLKTKQAVNYDALPGVKIVLIQYSGPVDDERVSEAQCGYVTWAEQSTLLVDAATGRCKFLTDVLSGDVRLNNNFSQLLDKAARAGDSGLWKRRFTLEVIDDCQRFVTEQQLPLFVSALDLYAEQYECTGVKGNRYGLNFMVHNHARHRLIYEAGSIESYQLLWLFTQAKGKYDKMCEKAHRGMKELVDIVLTFWQKLVTHLLSLSPRLPDEQVAAAVAPLAKLAHDRYTSLTSLVNDVRLAHKSLKRTVERRVTAVQDAYAAAEVREYRSHVSIPASLAALHADMVSGDANKYEPFDVVKTKMERVGSVYDMVANTWFFVGVACKTLHQQQEMMKHHDPVAVVQLLRALMLLRIWVPVTCSEQLLVCPFAPDEPLPPAAPRVLSAKEITDSHRTVVREVHPDHNRCTESATATTQDVNNARDLLMAHFVTRSPLHADD